MAKVVSSLYVSYRLHMVYELLKTIFYYIILIRSHHYFCVNWKLEIIQPVRRKSLLKSLTLPNRNLVKLWWWFLLITMHPCWWRTFETRYSYDDVNGFFKDESGTKTRLNSGNFWIFYPEENLKTWGSNQIAQFLELSESLRVIPKLWPFLRIFM